MCQFSTIVVSLENENIDAANDGNGPILSYLNEMDNIECGVEASII